MDKLTIKNYFISFVVCLKALSTFKSSVRTITSILHEWDSNPRPLKFFSVLPTRPPRLPEDFCLHRTRESTQYTVLTHIVKVKIY